ncbi:MAG: hypothetical protein AAGH40_09710 [Verrucomicrobiota bacterium]
MKIIRNILTAAWIGFFVSIFYIGFLVLSADPRLEGGNLTVFEIDTLEALIFFF